MHALSYAVSALMDPCSVCGTGTVCMWDLKAHMLLHTLRAHIGNSVRALCFGAGGRLYVAGSDSRVVLWNVRVDNCPDPNRHQGQPEALTLTSTQARTRTRTLT